LTKLKEIEIRRAEGLGDFFRIAEIQQEVWGFDHLNITAPELLMVHAEMGAVVLSAYTSAEEMVGFVYSFPGVREGKPMHWSHMLAVLSPYRGIGLGKRLKWRQRDEILKKGFDLCCWTFDPLQAINARFNIVSLGAVSGEYVVDAYGPRNGYFDGGFPTDRFVATWELKGRRASDCAEGTPPRVPIAPGSFKRAFRSHILESDPDTFEKDLSLDEEYVGVEIPGSMSEIRNINSELFPRWRKATREVFTSYFERGYLLVDIIKPVESGENHFIYILQRG